MGYRNYIGFLPKREYNKIKSLSWSDVLKHYNKSEDDYLGVYNFGKQLYEFGKYVDIQPPKGSMKNFFKNKETRKDYGDDCELFTVTPEFLEYIIQNYNDKIKKYYNQMIQPFFTDEDEYHPKEFLNSIKTDYNYPENKYTFDFTKITPEEQTALRNLIDHVQSMSREWTRLTPYDLKDGDEITTSWKYEYGLFELVRIYKYFDWKKNIMIYYGH